MRCCSKSQRPSRAREAAHAWRDVLWDREANMARPSRCAPLALRSVKLLLLGVFSLILVLLGTPLPMHAAQPSEYELKAAILFKITKFVTWPKPEKPQEVFRMGLLGEDPFDTLLDTVVEGKEVNGKAIQVCRARSPEDLSDCQLVFVARSEKDRLDSILATFSGKEILTVGDTEGLARQGLMINLTLHERKISFEINPDAVEKTHLKISSQLLGLATIVKTATGKEGQ